MVGELSSFGVRGWGHASDINQQNVAEALAVLMEDVGRRWTLVALLLDKRLTSFENISCSLPVLKCSYFAQLAYFFETFVDVIGKRTCCLLCFDCHTRVSIFFYSNNAFFLLARMSVLRGVSEKVCRK